MDGDERRRRALVAGREMLAKYKAECSVRDHNAGSNQTGEPSDEESSRNDVEVEPTKLQSTGMNEGISSRDRTYSSVSMSEGEGDGDLEGMAGRIAGLEELLEIKEAVVEALNAEIDHLRGDASSPNSSQSHNSSIQYRDLIGTYRTKLQEFEKAVVKRDSLIEDLSKSLTQALSTRDALLVQINSLNSMQLVNPNTKTTMELQERIFSLESTLNDQKMTINHLNSQVAQFVDQVKRLEMEKETQNAEINDYKLQVNQLNELIRVGAAENNSNMAASLEQQRQCEIRIDKIKKDMQVILDKVTAETSANASRNKKELKDIEEKHDVELEEIQNKYEQQLKLLKDENIVLADRLKKELPDIESRHAKELSVFQAQLTNYKKTVEDITSKYVAASSVLDSKESIERSLEQALANATTLKQENDTLKFKLDDLFTRYSTAQSLIENSQVHERSMSSRIYDLEKSLSRVSGINVSMLSELNETSYQTFDEVAIQFQITQQKLEEKLEMEKQLIEKIRKLEDDLRRSNDELEQANLTKRSYEKQLKDMKNTCDKLKYDINDIKESNSSAPKLFQSSLYFDSDEEGKKQDEVSSKQGDSAELVLLKNRLESYEQEIKDLQKSLQQKEAENIEYVNRLDVLTAKMKISEEKCEKLKTGLFDAYQECAEFRDKLNQTLMMNDNKIDDTDSFVHDSNISDRSKDNFNDVDDSVNITMESLSTCDENKPAVKEDTLDCASAQLLQFDVLAKEKDNLLKGIEVLMKKQSDYDEVVKKLNDRNVEFEKLELEKKQLIEENAKLIKRLEDMDLLHGRVDRLKEEKESLVKEIADLIDKHKEEMSVLKLNSSIEVQKLRSLSQSVKEETANLDELRAELETRHTKEMEEVRTYFEQKCLQMEKQYSEEVFSQQSKKMSDNDSEIEELTEDLYYGGAGDCLNVPNVSGRSSRTEVPLIDVKQKDGAYDTEETSKSKSDNMTKIEAMQCKLEQKMQEIQAIKLQYEHKLEEQHKLYKKELHEAKEKGGRISLLKAVNQALLSVNDPDAEEHWPPEFLELRNKFTNNTWNEMQKLKERHTEELTRLREEHSRDLARTIEHHQKEINRIKAECTNQNYNIRQTGDGHSFYEGDLIMKRDSLHKTCATLKVLVGELIKYFSICEEEVNNTLISEVLKTQLSRSEMSTECQEVGEDEVDNNLDTTEVSHVEGQDTLLKSPDTKIKRVHFAPQFSGIMSIMNSDDDTLHDLIEEDKDLTEKLKAELSNCLERLKSDSAEVLGISLTPGESKLDLLSKHALWISKINEDLYEKLAKTESVIIGYQEESEQLKVKILNLQQKLIAAENKKEIITEGYGEHDESGVDVTIQNLTQLQDKARLVLMNGGGESSHLLQLIEELCRHSDKITDDAKRDKEDLQQQIEAADKKLRATRKFLEEQASEREAERDEATRQILDLQEQIKKREREKERDLRITSEQSSLSPVPTSITPVLQTTDIAAAVEALESQMREMSSLMSDKEAKKSETESELKAAVDKIWVLRDVISDLEQQVRAKVEREKLLKNQNDQLEEVIAAQTKNQQELAQELDAIKLGSENSQLNEHIGHLQEELRKHKLSSEHFNANSSVLKQMRMELRDMQVQLDKRTKELEALHMCGSNLSLSQPSEDVSIREQIEASRCSTPDDPHSPPTLPLDQLLKLKEKMLKHARAEEVALKRIKDLDMQLTTLKNQNEILQAEQDILQQTTSEQLFQIEAMRGRLEHQKQSAPFAQRQATSRLELQLHDVNEKLHSLERTAADKDLEVKDMKSQLDRVNQLLMEKEAEIANAVQSENSIIQKLKDRVEVLEEEKKILESKVGMQERAQLELPQLIDSMLTDKNEEIDHLKEQISKKEKHLELYLSLNLDESQLKEFVRQTEPKNSARTLSDILSIHSECEDLPEAIREAPNLTHTLIHNVSNLKAVMSSQSKDTIEASPMSLIDASKIDIQVPRLELGSQSLSSTCPQQSQGSVGGELSQGELESKSSSSGESSISRTVDDEKFGNTPEKMNVNDLSKECMLVEQTRGALKSKETTSVANDFDDNVKSSSKRDNNSKSSQRCDDEAIKLQIQDLENQLTEVNEELRIKSLNLIKREAELSAIQKNLKELRTELKDTVESAKRDTLFYKNQYELTQVSENKIKKDLLQVENTLKLKTEELKEYKAKMQVNEKIIMELNGENSKLKREADEKEEQLLKKCESVLQEKAQELKNLKEIIFEKDITIETIETRNIEIENENKQLYEYKTKYELCSREFDECQNEIQRLTDGLNNRDQIIRRLEEMARRSSLSGGSSPSDNKNQEIHHLQEYLKEKDKVIRQMSDDSKSLHRALETIQSKMKESGNVVELRKKLKEERKINMELKELVERLKKDLGRLKSESSRHLEEDVDIEDMVQRELNLSARLDRQIMNAIESESEDGTVRPIEKNSYNSLEIEPMDQERQEVIVQKYNDVRLKLKQAYKVNEELIKLKEDLEIEREMLKSQVAEYESRILQIKSDLEEESRKVAKLDKDLSTERNTVRNLRVQIQKEQNSMHASQMHDSELIALLRVKLEASLDVQEKIRGDLTLMRREYKSLETQLSAVREQIKSQEMEEIPGLTELLETEQRKYIMLTEEHEKEQRKNSELENTLKRIAAEKNRYEKLMEIVVEDKEKLVSSLVLVEGIKEHLDTDLKRTKEELKGREEECEWLQKRIKTMTDAEAKRQHQRSSEHNELKSLRREIGNARDVMLDLEADMKQSKKELNKSLERQAQLARCVETLTEREAEINKKLEVAKDEEKRLKEVIADMQNDLQLSVRRELELTDELQRERFSSEKNVPAKFVQKIKELNENIEKQSRDKAILHDKLTKAREEKEQFAGRLRALESQFAHQPTTIAPYGLNVINTDMVEKLQHFYGKYLRVDSRRKALAYQKRYLLCVVGGYQLSEQNTLSILAQLTQNQRLYATTSANRKSPKIRFKSAALVIIGIHRMKWMILRWRTGRRVGANAVLGNANQSFMPLPRPTVNHSPPVRDKLPGNGDAGQGGFAFEHYLQRFTNIQQTLNSAMADLEPNNLILD